MSDHLHTRDLALDDLSLQVQRGPEDYQTALAQVAFEPAACGWFVVGGPDDFVMDCCVIGYESARISAVATILLDTLTVVNVPQEHIDHVQHAIEQALIALRLQREAEAN